MASKRRNMFYKKQETNNLPHYMVNMEVWFPPDLDGNLDLFSTSEWGSITSPGRFGWFIPMELSNVGPNKSISLDRWMTFTDPNIARLLHQDHSYIEKFAESGDEIKYCCKSRGCVGQYYVPERCQEDRTRCATLLADYPSMLH
ncbi:hypothetical protein AAG570_001733 [Ranatra chinensis]|uniref:Uncharacterized protein n=1 Tax=Ranatra chinensis TaxID=642074 RepID=A0ABD0Y9C6_9HEMI